MPCPRRWVECAQVAPRLVLEAVPLAEEVVPAVIADLRDLGMHHRHLRDVRSIDDHLAAVGDDRLQLVKPFAAVQMSSYLVGMIDSTRLTGASR